MLPPTLHVSQHPAVLHKLAILRDEATEPKKFREIVRELSWLLGYEALADARVRTKQVTTPIETMEGHELGAGHDLERGLDVPGSKAGVGEGLVAEQPRQLPHDLAELLRLGLLVAQDSQLVEHGRMLGDVEVRGEHRSAS